MTTNRKRSGRRRAAVAAGTIAIAAAQAMALGAIVVNGPPSDPDKMDLQELVEALNKTVKDFRDENDKLIKQVEKDGKENATTRANVETLNKSITDLQAAVTKRSDELENKMNMLQLGGAGGNGASSDVKNAAEFSKQRGVKVEAADYRKYCDAMDVYLRKGPAAGAEIMNTLQVGSDPDGGFWVPPDRSGPIMKKLYETSPMRQYALVIPIGSDALEGPIDNDEADSGWTGAEQATRTDPTDTPKVGMYRIPAHEQFAQPRITQKMLDDAQFPVETWLDGKVSEKLARTENTAFVIGNGSAKPRGFLDYTKVTTTDATRAWDQIQYIASGAAGAFASSNPADKLIDMAYSLKAGYRTNANWAMARLTVATIRKFKDGNGQYLWQPGLSSSQPQQILGWPVAEFEDMPAIAANSYSIAFGDFKSAYIIVDRLGIRVLRDPYTTKGSIKFYTTKRTGGGLVNGEAIKLMKFAAS